ncbi:MAG: type II toxin-antitoxin system HicB family antitoxin [Patescibacteria group bacterium]
MIHREFTAIYQQRGKWIIAWIEEIPGVNTQGRTLKEVKENLREALRLIVETNRKFSQKDGNVRREPFEVMLPA